MSITRYPGSSSIARWQDFHSGRAQNQIPTRWRSAPGHAKPSNSQCCRWCKAGMSTCKAHRGLQQPQARPTSREANFEFNILACFCSRWLSGSHDWKTFRQNTKGHEQSMTPAQPMSQRSRSRMSGIPKAGPSSLGTPVNIPGKPRGHGCYKRTLLLPIMHPIYRKPMSTQHTALPSSMPTKPHMVSPPLTRLRQKGCLPGSTRQGAGN